ncbi:MAG TPA: acetylglutamate kinase [Candidatus Binataceae bacterium]|nr:acetylglutamate kinase [Candidatus Binataceae bacterium]
MDLIERARVLAEALPYIQRFRGATFVIKYGGHAMLTPELRESFARDVVLLESVGIRVVVVHGGGPQITELIGRLGLQANFVRGMRVTDAATMDAAEMVLQKLNKEIVQMLWRVGGRAVGLSGKDGDLMIAHKLLMTVTDNGRRELVDLGLVGEIERVNAHVLAAFQQAGFIPVVAPVGAGEGGLTYNINADVAAGALAGALKAEKLILLTDVEGVKSDGHLLHTLDAARARRMIESGAIGEGMIPKVECCLAALAEGVRNTHIIDGRVQHSILLEVFTETGVGTEVIDHATAGTPTARAGEKG